MTLFPANTNTKPATPHGYLNTGDVTGKCAATECERIKRNGEWLALCLAMLRDETDEGEQQG